MVCRNGPGMAAGPVVKTEIRKTDKSYLSAIRINFEKIPVHPADHFGIRSIPQRRRTSTVIQKNPTVSRQFAASAVQKFQP